MKTTHILALAGTTLSLLALAVAAPRLARADASQGLGAWEGSGVATEVSGKEIGPFTIELTRHAAGSGIVRTDGKIHTGSGQDIVFWQELEDHGGGGFTTRSNNGTGGGRCFGNAMCQSYEQRADGHAFATTIARDGTDKLRVLVTELEGGKAQRFYAQTLAKK